MLSSPPDLDRELADLYRQQAEEYAQALQVLRELPAVFATGAHPDGPMHRLGLIMARVTSLETSIARVKQAWEQLERPASDQLQRAIQRIRALLIDLLPLISSAESEAQTAKEKLLPQLSDEARGQRMKHAYGAASRPT
jgi:hypothetical protein